jgi:hypothetical protein
MHARRDRSRELPRISVSFTEAQRVALERRARRAGTTPHQIIRDALAGIDAPPPVSVSFPALATARTHLALIQDSADRIAAAVVQRLAGGSGDVSPALMDQLAVLHADLAKLHRQLEQGD